MSMKRKDEIRKEQARKDKIEELRQEAYKANIRKDSWYQAMLYSKECAADTKPTSIDLELGKTTLGDRAFKDKAVSYYLPKGCTITLDDGDWFYKTPNATFEPSKTIKAAAKGEHPSKWCVDLPKEWLGDTTYVTLNCAEYSEIVEGTLD